MKKRLTEERKIAARFCVSDSHDFARRVAPSKSVHCLGGVYIHVPFCKQKCFYCDFPSYAGKERYEEAYVKALIQEIRTEGAKYVSKWGNPATIYIGGGTPSVLPNDLLEPLLDELLRTFRVRQALPLGELSPQATERVVGSTIQTNSIEFTVECNPGTIDESKFTLLKRHARAAGFQNLSLDLIYGLPGETLAMLQSDIDEALALAPDHISIYGLQLEEGTAFWRQHEMGKLDLPDDAATEAMYDLMTTALPAHGYERYEISNFAKPGFESCHNLGYWQDKPYLGLGAAAHSYLDGVRYENTKNIAAYIDAIEHGILPCTQEEPATRAIQMEEFAFLALRTATGIDKAAFKRRFATPLSTVYADAIERMKAKGLLEETETHVRLTAQGMKYGNWVFEAFLLA